MYRPKGKNLKNGRRNINQNEVITKNENLPPPLLRKLKEQLFPYSIPSLNNMHLRKVIQEDN